MRMKVGALAVGLVASVLAVGPADADETSTTIDASSTTVEDTTTTVGDPSSTVEETTSTVGDTTTTVVDCTPPTTAVDPTTTVADPTTTTTVLGCTTTTVAEPEPEPEPSVAVSAPAPPASPVPSVGPASPGSGPPIRGTQVVVREIPPPPTTTTTTTTTTLPPVWVVPANSGSGRRVVYSKSAQRVWAVDSNGVMIKTHRVSGRQTPLDPRPGTYKVWSRSRYTYSITNPSITWGYMVRFAWGARGGNIGFHEIPYQYGSPVQSVSQLGQPLSGGCVRQAVHDAIWMWNWAHLGTKVVVLG